MMNDFRFDELVIGFERKELYRITPEIYEKFIQISGDVNPLHVDQDHAERNSFPSVVMHGGILHGFLSHFVGMILPGKNAILLSCEIRYSKPNFLLDEIELAARVSERAEEHQIVNLDFTFRNLTQAYVGARARVQVGVLKA